MKKTFAILMVIILTISLLTACKEGGSNNSQNGSNKGTTKDVISASALVSAEEATAIMKVKMEKSESDSLKLAFTDRVKYVSDNGPTISINLYQEALYNKDDSNQQSAMKKGWTNLLQRNENPLIKKAEEGHEEVITTKLTGIGRAAYLDDSKLGDIWTIFVFYDEYMIYITVLLDLHGNTPADIKAQYIEKTIDLSKLALENLKAIID